MIFVLIVAVISLFFCYRMFGICRHLPPGPTPWPIVGNLFQMDAKNPDKTLAKWGKQYGGVYTVSLPKPAVVITDFELMKESIVKQGDVYAGRPSSFLFNLYSGGKFGIVLSDGPHWQEQRRFTLRVLRDLGFNRNIMESQVMLQVDRLVEQVNSIKGEAFYPKEILSVCVGSIISQLLFGHPYNFDDQQFHKLDQLINRLGQIFTHPAAIMMDLYPWLRYVPLFGHFKYDEFIIQVRDFRRFIFDEIDEHKRNFIFDETVQPEDYIQSFLKELKCRERNGEPLGSFSEWQLYMTLGDLLVAGMETVVATLLWGIGFMVCYPEIQQKVHSEIDQEVGKTAVITMNCKILLPYVSATISEMQRLGNIIPINLFHETTENVVLRGYKIPTGTTIVPQISAVMQDPHLFTDPDEFKPERFLEEDGKMIQKVDYLVPFSMGKRQCLGESLAKMELFLVFTTLMQKFKFTIPDGGQKPSLERVQGMSVSPMSYKCHAEAR